MPPLPALRRTSSAKELRGSLEHKRGRSLESRLSFNKKVDDLKLFNEMEMRENDNSLLHSNEDIDDSLSKLKNFSDYKFGIKAPISGGGGGLLNDDDGDKNEYEWLLTPPETPLFPSLDDDEFQPPNLVTRGRQRSQPISISVADKHRGQARAGGSPHRRSSSPRPGTSILQSRVMSSSAPQSTPDPVLHPATPSRRSSTPPNKSSPSARRSLTPTLRRINSTSGGETSSSGRRGTSPIKGSRGSSSSQKLQEWQSNIPGFSPEAPPNLRTSISDRPASYSRGSSPASRSKKEASGSRSSRRSRSPTALRSASTSHSHSNDRPTPSSKGHIASFADDDVDLLHASGSSSSTARKQSILDNNRTVTYSKKPSTSMSSTSAPKRSFDSALRKMDHRVTPQSMFRPLMSNVLPSTFVTEKESLLQHPMFFKNSSLTTSNNTGSEQAAIVAPSTKDGDHDRSRHTGEWDRVLDSGSKEQDEMFNFDETEERDLESKHGIRSEETLSMDTSSTRSTEKGAESESNCVTSDVGETDSKKRMATCSICGESFQIAVADNSNIDVCQECFVKDGLLTSSTNNTHLNQEDDFPVARASEQLIDQHQSRKDRCESSSKETTSSSILAVRRAESVEQDHDVPNGNSVSPLVTAEKGKSISERLEFLKAMDSLKSNNYSKHQQSQSVGSDKSSRVDALDGTGITVLLKRSSSSKGLLVQGRAISASGIPCAELSYAREKLKPVRLNSSWDGTSAATSFDIDSSKPNASAMPSAELSYARENLMPVRLKSSSSWDGTSASTSFDMGFSKPKGAHLQQQRNRRKGDMDNLNNELDSKTQSSSISNSKETAVVAAVSADVVTHSGLHCDGQIPPVITEKDRFAGNAEYSSATSSTVQKTGAVYNNYTEGADLLDIPKSESPRLSHHDTDVVQHNEENVVNTEGMVDNNYTEGADLLDIPKSESPRLSHHDTDVVQHNEKNVVNTEGVVDNCSNFIIDGESCFTQTETCTSVKMLKTENSDDGHVPSISSLPEKNQSSDHHESNNDSHAQSTNENSVGTAESPRAQRSRSLTLEDATDTILLCSSIVHDLAHKAAAIGSDKEQPSQPEILWPTNRKVETSASNRKSQSKTVPTRRTPKSQRMRRTRQDTADEDMMPTPPTKDSKVEECKKSENYLPYKDDSLKPPKTEAKCNCMVM